MGWGNRIHCVRNGVYICLGIEGEGVIASWNHELSQANISHPFSLCDVMQSALNREYSQLNHILHHENHHGR